MAGKKNIALFAAILENDFSSAVVKGAVKGARECDANLIVFPVDLINARYAVESLNLYRYQSNTLSAFMNARSLDGIIIEYGTITSYLDDDGKKKFLEGVAGYKPTVLLAEKAEGFCSYTVDNECGLVEILEHLITFHNYKKIGMLSGPLENFDAAQRLNTFKKVLSEHDLYLGDDWVVYGNFSDYVEEVTNELLDRHPDIEVIVCANDAMAIGASRTMLSRGIVPGKDVFITGFDDLAASFLHEPALTTVKADPVELANNAVHLICESIDIAPENHVTKTRMVKRESCGCCGFDLDERWKRQLGISSNWRDVARHQMSESLMRYGLEKELGNITREIVFSRETDNSRYDAILNTMRRLQFKSCGLFLYDEYITHERDDKWVQPEKINLVGYYSDIENMSNNIMDIGYMKVPMTELFDWGMVRDGNRHEILILPLYFGINQIGIIAVEGDHERFVHAQDMAGQISSMLYITAMNEKQEAMRRELEEANRAKSQFLANMSHEIRTPINAIVGFNEMIIRENKEESIADYAGDVKAAADALLLLVNDTLDFTKIEAGKMTLVNAEYKLMEILNNVVQMMTTRAESKGLAIFLRCDKSLPSVLNGDAGRIQQILINLVSNAVKYTERGKVIINVTGKVQENNVALSFKVIDTGIGIKEEDISKLFNVFERIEEKRNRNIEGSGLGINITSGLLRLMNSELKVKSKYGEGSEFSFVITQEVIDHKKIADSEKEVLTKKVEGETPDFIAPAAKILVVDDNFLNRKVIGSLLKDTKIQVDQAEGGRACIEMVRNKKYDIILLDIMMPEMDGVETLKELISSKYIDVNLTPVIALTANAIAGAKDEYLESGFSDYLAKPVKPRDLNEMLLKYIPASKVKIL